MAKLRAENDALVAKVKRLEEAVNLYKEKFVRWQKNLYMMPDVDMEKLDFKLNKPLYLIDRSNG